MIYYIYGWYGEEPQKRFPEAEKRKLKFFKYENKKVVDVSEEVWTIEIEDIHAFVENWGRTIHLVPPTDLFPHWSIYFSDTGRWGQR